MNEAPPEQESAEEARARRRARSEAKDQAVRESLEPLEPGERPLAVTIASVIAGLLALGNILTYALSDHAAGADRGKEIFQTFAICAILAAASWGMWRAKYWAVLGFQTILGLQILVLSLSILTASNVLVAALFLTIILLSSVLFWFLIRAMARIQMPEAPDVKKLHEQREEAEQAARARESENSDG